MKEETPFPSPLHFSNHAHVILTLGTRLDSLSFCFVALSKKRDLMFFFFTLRRSFRSSPRSAKVPEGYSVSRTLKASTLKQRRGRLCGRGGTTGTGREDGSPELGAQWSPKEGCR